MADEKASVELEGYPDEKIPKVVGDYLKTVVSPEVKAYAVSKLSEGRDIKIAVLPAKENGSYRGRVLLNNDKYLVQVVGKEEKTAIVHDKKNLTLVAQKLEWMDKMKRMNGQQVQLHYDGEKGKVYPWNPLKEAERKAEKTATPDFLEQFKGYVATLPKKQRESLGRHMEAAEAFAEKNPAQAHATATKRIAENMEILKQNPALAGKSSETLEKLAYWRGVVQEDIKHKPPAAQEADLAKFDRKAEDPAFLEKLEQSATRAPEEHAARRREDDSEQSM